MRRTFYASTLALLFAAFAAADARAQSAAATLPLPAADAVLTLDVRTLFAEVIPRTFATDKARLAQVNADVDEFKARTGIDPREFEAMLVGARIVPLPSGATKIDRVTVLAAGLPPDALVTAARAAARAGHRADHGGKKVTSPRQLPLRFRLARMRVSSWPSPCSTQRWRRRLEDVRAPSTLRPAGPADASCSTSKGSGDFSLRRHVAGRARERGAGFGRTWTARLLQSHLLRRRLDPAGQCDALRRGPPTPTAPDVANALRRWPPPPLEAVPKWASPQSDRGMRSRLRAAMSTSSNSRRRTSPVLHSL